MSLISLSVFSDLHVRCICNVEIPTVLQDLGGGISHLGLFTVWTLSSLFKIKSRTLHVGDKIGSCCQVRE